MTFDTPQYINFLVSLPKDYHSKKKGGLQILSEYVDLFTTWMANVKLEENLSNPKAQTVKETCLTTIEAEVKAYGFDDVVGWTLTGYALDANNKVRQSNLELDKCIYIEQDSDLEDTNTGRYIRPVNMVPPKTNLVKVGSKCDFFIYVNQDNNERHRLWARYRRPGKDDSWSDMDLNDYIRRKDGHLEWVYPG
jgi:hypothetical protein